MTIDGVIIKGKRGRILGSYFRPDDPKDGKKQPVIILCHGIPGNDQLLDFAYLLQEHGYHVMSFEYSGSWGSDGDYSLSNVVEDIDTVLNWILEQQDDRVDQKRIYFLCHSLGGFGGVNVFARRPEVAAGAFLSPANITDLYDEAKKSPDTLKAFVKEMDELCEPLNGIDGDKIVAEIEQKGESFRFENVASGFGTRPVLLVRATNDVLTPSPICADVLKRVEDGIPGSHCELETYEAPHDYLNVRGKVRERVLKFFDSISK